MSGLFVACAAVLGLVFGSFFNVCIYRVPRGMSIATPPSACPRCKRRIRLYDNIPVLSWLLLRGRCRDCHQPIPLRYPLVELLAAALFVLVYLRFGYSVAALKALVFVSLLEVASFIDLDHQIIPFVISLPGVAIGLLGSIWPPPTLAQAALGACIGAVFVLGAWLLWRYALAPAFRRRGVNQKEGMGWGDLPMAAMIGAFVGPKATAAALFVAVLSGVVVGIAARAGQRLTRGQAVPFGPFLALGGAVGLFFGNRLFDLYWRLMLP